MYFTKQLTKNQNYCLTLTKHHPLCKEEMKCTSSNIWSTKNSDNNDNNDDYDNNYNNNNNNSNNNEDNNNKNNNDNNNNNINNNNNNNNNEYFSTHYFESVGQMRTK